MNNDLLMDDTFENFNFTQNLQTISETLSRQEKRITQIRKEVENPNNDIFLDDTFFISQISFSEEKNAQQQEKEAATVENVLPEPEIRNLATNYTEKVMDKSDENTPLVENVDGRDRSSQFEEVEKNARNSNIPFDSRLSSWGLPENVLEKYESKNLTSMFPWQVACLTKPEVLEGKNLVYSAPTSAGKTLVAEVIAIKTILERKKKVIFILPFVSIVREKMYYFQNLLETSGIRVDGFMGSYNPPGGFGVVQFAICTIEKANSLINRLLEEGKLSDIGAVLIDEIHLLGDSSRGYLLELLLTKLRYISKKENLSIQIIGMSATLPNLDQIANWLDAELYTTNFRPVPLNEQAHVCGEIYDNTLKLIKTLKVLPELTTDSDNILQLCLETIKDSCSVLIFCPTKNWCENLAQQIATGIFKIGSSTSDWGTLLRSQLDKNLIMELLEQLKFCPVGLDDVLRKTVSFGVAFHHAGLTMDERDIIEGAFRNGALRVLVATSTLSSGVNLPARRVIIRTPIFHRKPLDSLVYRQMIGRAGRMGKDTVGESFLICQKNEFKIAKELMSAELPAVQSCLESAGKLKRAILEVVASGVVSTPQDVKLFTESTLLSMENGGTYEMNNPIDEAIEFLHINEFIRLQKNEEGGERYTPSSLGKACLSSSIAPDEGLSLFAELEKARQCLVLETELHLIYLVTPYSACYSWENIDWMFYLDLWEKLPSNMKKVGELVGIREIYLVNATRGKIMTNTGPSFHKYLVHKRFFVALALQDLVNEKPLSWVCQKFNCNRGMLQSLQQSASSFAGMVTAFSKQLGWSSMELLLSQFQERMQFGVSRDLLDLMHLPVLNGKMARSLYNAGIETVIQLANSEISTIENILHRVVPFESEKEREGESEYAKKQRNKYRNVWITGREGLTEKEAAEIFVMEARKYLKVEMGLVDAKWKEGDEESEAESDEEVVNLKQNGDKPGNFQDGEKPAHILNGGKLANIRNDDKLGNSRDGDEPGVIQNGDKPANIENDDKPANIPNGVEPGVITNGVKPANIKNCGQPENIRKGDRPAYVRNGDILGNIQDGAKPENIQNGVKPPNIGYGDKPANIRNGDKLANIRNGDEVGNIQNDDKPTNIQNGDTPANIRNGEKLGDIQDGHKPGNTDNSVKLRNIQNGGHNLKRSAATDSKESRLDEHVAENYVSDDSSVFSNEINISDTSSISNTDSTKIEDVEDGDDLIKETSNRLSAKLEKITINSPLKVKTLDRGKNDISNILGEITLSDFSETLSETSVTRNSAINEVSRLIQPPSVELNISGSSMSISFDKNQSDRSLFDESFNLQLSDNNSSKDSAVGGFREENRNVCLGSESFLREAFGESFHADDDVFGNSIEEEHLLLSAKKRKCDDVENVRSKKVKVKEDSRISPDEDLNKTHLSEKLEDQQIVDFGEMEVVNVCRESELLDAFGKEIKGQNCFSLSIACTKFIETRSSIGQNILKTEGPQLRNSNSNGENKVQFTCDGRKIEGFSFSWESNVAYYVGLENVKLHQKILKLLKAICKNSDVRIRMFDAKEQIKVIAKCCRLNFCCRIDDPKIADWILDPEGKEKNLSAMALKYCPEGTEMSRLSGGCKGVGSVGLDTYSDVDAKTRSSLEAILTWHLTDALKNVLRHKNPKYLESYDVESDIIVTLAKMEIDGIGVNKASLKTLLDTLKSQISSVEKKAYAFAGRYFNFSSSTDVAKVTGMFKGRKVSTRKQILEKNNHPISDLVLQWRKLHMILTKTLYPLIQATVNDRIHGCYVTHTATGRISMHEPNLQNITKDFTIDVSKTVNISCREIFEAADGCELVSADYCQLELRILTHFSQDSLLCKIMREPGDVFRTIAAKWNRIGEDEVTDTLRQSVKHLCYGIIYGMGSKTLSEQLNVEEMDAIAFMETFRNTYPGIKNFVKQTIENCRKCGYVETVGGRRRFLPNINDAEQAKKGQAERQAVNTIVQGSAADIVKKAMIKVEKELREIFHRTKSKPKMILHLHDELIYEVPGKYLKKVAKIMKKNMENSVELSVPFPVKLKTGKSWGTMSELIL